MASEIRVNQIQNRSGLTTVTWNDEGLNVVGVVTATTFKGALTGNISGGTVAGSTGTFSSNVTIAGNLGVAGTVTYEDVARVDATGISTFREGFGVGPLAGIALTAYSDGSIRSTGIITATTFGGETNSIFTTGGTERVRITSAGRILIGHTASQEVYGTNRFQIQGTSSTTSGMSLLRHGGSPYLALGATGGSSLGAVNAVSSGDRLGQLTFVGADGTDVNTHSCSIAGYVDGSVSGNAVPGRLVFKTSTGASELERMRIDSVGMTGVRTAVPRATLHVKAHDNNWEGGILLEDNTGDDGWNIHPESSDASLLFGYNDNTSLALTSQTAELMVKITSAGNLGVGLPSPNVRLHAQDDSATETTILKLRNYKSGVNTKPTLTFEASSSGNQGANSSIQGLAGTDAGGSNSANDSGMKFIVRHGGAGSEREAFTIKKDGNIHFPNGQGISFAATADTGTTGASTTSELLEDYEEGSWTPILYAYNGTQNQGYDTQTGNYIKIGHQVIANFVIDFNSKGTVSGNYTFIGGLPYTHAGNTAGTMVVWGWAMGSNIGWIAGDISSTNTVAWVTYHDNNNNNTGYLPSSFLYDNSQIKGTLIYRST